MNIAVIDVGTSSMRVAVYDEQGKRRLTGRRAYRPVYRSEVWVEQDACEWQEAMLGLLTEASAGAAALGLEIGALSLTAQRSSVIPIGENDEPLEKAIMWQDKRSLPFLEELKRAGKGERVFALSGSRLNPVYSAPKMMWLKRSRPRLYARAKRLAVIPDFLLHLLTGKWATDATYASRSLLMNLRGQRWDRELLEIFGLEEEKLNPIVSPGSAVGGLLPSMAARTGLKAGIPVVTAGGDQQCGAMGAGCYAPGSLEVSAGTGAYVIASVDRVPPVLRGEVICNAAGVPGTYILEGSVLCCASALNWLLRLLYGLDGTNGGQVYRELAREAEAALEGGRNPLVLPFFQGRGTPDWNSTAKGAIFGLTLGTGRGDLACGLLEGLACEIAENIGAIEAYSGRAGELVLIGGLSNSDVFNRILAAASGRPVRRFGDSEATAIGAWMAAAVSLGLFPSYREAFQTARAGQEGEVTAPEKELSARLGAVREQYRAMYVKAVR